MLVDLANISGLTVLYPEIRNKIYAFCVDEVTYKALFPLRRREITIPHETSRYPPRPQNGVHLFFEGDPFPRREETHTFRISASLSQLCRQTRFEFLPLLRQHENLYISFADLRQYLADLEAFSVSSTKAIGGAPGVRLQVMSAAAHSQIKVLIDFGSWAINSQTIDIRPLVRISHVQGGPKPNCMFILSESTYLRYRNKTVKVTYKELNRLLDPSKKVWAEYVNSEAVERVQLVLPQNNIWDVYVNNCPQGGSHWVKHGPQPVASSAVSFPLISIVLRYNPESYPWMRHHDYWTTRGYRKLANDLELERELFSLRITLAVRKENRLEAVGGDPPVYLPQ
jgi:hypothetical protein